jgi:hypothetical protein
VNKKTGKITVDHVYAAQDAGLTVNPNLVENQMLGSTIQGVSRALNEQIRFSKSYVTSTDWVTYGHLRFKDSPGVTNIVVQRIDKPSLGSGEPPTCPIVGAIANAFYDATGVCRGPLTPARGDPRQPQACRSFRARSRKSRTSWGASGSLAFQTERLTPNDSSIRHLVSAEIRALKEFSQSCARFGGPRGRNAARAAAGGTGRAAVNPPSTQYSSAQHYASFLTAALVKLVT